MYMHTALLLASLSVEPSLRSCSNVSVIGTTFLSLCPRPPHVKHLDRGVSSCVERPRCSHCGQQSP